MKNMYLNVNKKTKKKKHVKQENLVYLFRIETGTRSSRVEYTFLFADA